MKSLFLIILMIMSGIPDPDLIVSVRKDRYCYRDSAAIYIEEYSLENRSSERIYTWIDFDYSAESSDIETAVKKYFYSRHGDFTFAQLFFDNVTFTNFSPIIGWFFLKVVNPGESFRYICLDTKEVLDTKDVLDHIVSLRESVFSQMTGFTIDLEYNTTPLYKQDYIIIPSFLDIACQCAK